MKEKGFRFGLAFALIFLFSAGLPGAETERPYLEAALKAARWISRTTVDTGQGIGWPSDPQDPKSVNSTLYSGNPGVILFYLELFGATRNQEFLRLACRGADLLLSGLTQEKSAGLYVGLAGIGFALEETYKAAREEKYRDGFLRALAAIQGETRKAGRGIEWDGTTDIISGSAGIGLFLLYAAAELKEEKWAGLAELAGSRLVELGRPEGGGLKWAMDEKFPRLMPNFSHGTAGVAYFLSRLYEKTKKKEYLDAALAGATYLRSVAKTEGDICLIFHDEPDGKDLYYLGWCHGPVGTANLFYSLLKITREKTWLEWVKRAARGIMESGIPEKQAPGLWNNAAVCCGLAGVGDFFLNLFRATQDKTYLDFCQRTYQVLLGRATAEGDGLKWIQAEHRTKPDFLVAQTGLMQGAAGIGLYLLHLDSLEQKRPIRIVLPDSAF